MTVSSQGCRIKQHCRPHTHYLSLSRVGPSEILENLGKNNNTNLGALSLRITAASSHSRLGSDEETGSDDVGRQQCYWADATQLFCQFKGVQVLVEKLEGQSVLSHVENLDRDVSQLKEWVSGLTEKREKLQENLSGLSQAVRGIEERTTVITQDVSAKVASVRTDVRRMAGLESEVEALLASEQELEEKVAHAERAMVKRIGDVLASSIDRVTVLKSSTDRNGQSLERLRRQLAELSAADAALAGRLQTLESGRARLLKTVTFASDLKPKVSTIKKDFALLEPQMADLTLRIGRLAEDMMRREEDIAVLRETLANLTAVQGDLRSVQQQLTQVPNISDVFPQTNEPGE
ncbi:inhibitor of nuclear factor kappa-B kinase-interacting protein isoform X3 [Anguilla rostrata]|uniref:inhibitor of nuclear factor kappa-B kinase-interacting protein isoform X3 n=1 Tax=Anguilla rostrata TaxID=7938 RepID=UPI0030CC888C